MAQAGVRVAYRRQAWVAADTGRDGPGLDVALVGGQVAGQNSIAGVLVIVWVAAGVVGAFVTNVVPAAADPGDTCVTFRTGIVVVTGATFRDVEATLDHVADVLSAGVLVVAVKNDFRAADAADAAAQRAVQFHVAGRSQRPQLHSAFTRLFIAHAFAAVAGEVRALVILGARGLNRNIQADLLIDSRLATAATDHDPHKEYEKNVLGGSQCVATGGAHGLTILDSPSESIP